MSSNLFRRLIQELQRDPHSRGWTAKLQRACEVFWDSLAAPAPQDFADQDVNALIALLLNSDSFAVARLVVPALRELEIDQSVRYHRQQLRVLEATSDVRRAFRRVETARQSDFDDILYVAEKQTLLNAELQRARVLLHQSGAFGSASEDQIMAWLSAHPDMT